MKKLTILLTSALLVGCIYEDGTSCVTGDTRIDEQADVDLVNEYTCFTDNLTIQKGGHRGGFTLENLETIDGSLIIEKLDYAATVDLPAAKSIGGNLEYRSNNQQDSDFCLGRPWGPLEGPVEINGDVIIQDNKYWYSSECLLERVEDYKGSLIIKGNPTVRELYWTLDGAATIADDLVLENNDSLESVWGFDWLTTIGGDLIIRGNATLEDLQEFARLTDVAGQIVIEDNALLPQCEACDLIGYLGFMGPVSISGNKPDGCRDDCSKSIWD